MKAQKSEIGLCNSKCLELVDNEQDAHDADMESVTLLLTANDIFGIGRFDQRKGEKNDLHAINAHDNLAKCTFCGLGNGC